MSKKRKKSFIVLAAVTGVVLIAAGLFLFLLTPSNSRAWKMEHERHPEVTFDGSRVTVAGVRNFREATGERRYEARTYDLDDIESIWFVVSVFDESGWRGPAHTMLSFGFRGGDYVVVSVEARKELGESYSAFRGLFRKYELIYVVGDERDLILTRAVHRKDQVFLYPIHAAPEKIRSLFVEMLTAADRLREKPEYYNTLTNNCTSRLRRHVNKVSPGLIPPTWKTILPGYSDELVKSLGLLDSELSVNTARHRYWINDRARESGDNEDFSRKIRGL